MFPLDAPYRRVRRLRDLRDGGKEAFDDGSTVERIPRGGIFLLRQKGDRRPPARGAEDGGLGAQDGVLGRVSERGARAARARLHSLAFLQNRTRFATKEECAEKANFCSFVSERYGLREKCALVGMSCGGAHALTFAGLYPEKAACLYLDAPVVSYLSYPGRFGDPECESVWENEFVLAYPGVRRMDLLSFGNHPISRVQTLIDRKIPVLLVYGTQDATVPYDENGRLLEEAYEGYPGLLTVLPCALRGHHPHGLADPAPIADFIEAACRAARA